MQSLGSGTTATILLLQSKILSFLGAKGVGKEQGHMDPEQSINTEEGGVERKTDS